MEYRYFPAILPTLCGSPRDKAPTCQLDERCCELWGEDYYPYALLSYAHWGAAKKHHHAFATDAFLVGDSGGYSIMTQGMDIAPEDVIRWQIRRTRVGFLLDVPPFAPTLKRRVSIGWENGLRRTAENVRRALPWYQKALAEGSPFRWWGVIQGRTAEEIAEWWETISEIYPFVGPGEGWGFSNVGATVEQTAYIFGQFRDLGIRNIHALGAGGARGSLTLCLGKLGGFDLVTFDTAWASSAAAIRTVIVPGVVPHELSDLSERDRDAQHLATEYLFSCPCPSCVLLRKDYPTSRPSRKALDLFRRMHTHNIIALRRATQSAGQEAERDADRFLREVLPPKKVSKVLRALDGQEPSAPKNRPRGTSLLDWVR